MSNGTDTVINTIYLFKKLFRLKIRFLFKIISYIFMEMKSDAVKVHKQEKTDKNI